jgi:hypothetical protein
MNDLPDQHDELNSTKGVAEATDRAEGFTRRTIIAGAAATAAASVGPIDIRAKAESADPRSREQMVLFVLLSAALTGIGEAKLAPGFGFKVRSPTDKEKLQNLNLSSLADLIPGSDPVDIKKDYFNLVNERRPAAFERLLRVTRESLNPDRAKSIIEAAQSDTATKYLARSIVLMWYLGAWYDPDDLMAHEKASIRAPEEASKAFVPFEVISSKAYTQSWVLRVAQAHPMGFSELQFGYWSRLPNPREFDFS